MSASLAQVIRRQNKPPVQRTQLRPQFPGQQPPAETRTCFHCQTVGHITWHCPLLQQQGQPQQPGQALPTQQQAFNNRQRQTNINVMRTDQDSEPEEEEYQEYEEEDWYEEPNEEEQYQ